MLDARLLWTCQHNEGIINRVERTLSQKRYVSRWPLKVVRMLTLLCRAFRKAASNCVAHSTLSTRVTSDTGSKADLTRLGASMKQDALICKPL